MRLQCGPAHIPPLQRLRSPANLPTHSPPALRSIEELREYHSLQYLTALAHVQKLKEAQRAAAGLQDDCAPFPGCGTARGATAVHARAGKLQKENTCKWCPTLHRVDGLVVCSWRKKSCPGQSSCATLHFHFPPPGVPRRLFEYAALLAGGSLQAAAGLASGRWGTAVHFDGGRHHAHKSRAAGFCYVNDVVRFAESVCVGLDAVRSV